MDYTVNFKDALGNELKPGDLVLKPRGNGFVERKIGKVTLIARDGTVTEDEYYCD